MFPALFKQKKEGSASLYFQAETAHELQLAAGESKLQAAFDALNITPIWPEGACGASQNNPPS